MLISKALLTLIGYGVMSTSITIFNKMVLSAYNFAFPVTLMVSQSVISLLFLWLMKQFGSIPIEDFNVTTAIGVFPLAIVFMVYVLLSFCTLGALNLPMFTALRRTTVVIVLLGEFFVLSRKPTTKTVVSTGIQVVGAVIAALTDLTFEPYGYILLALTNVATAGYTIAIAYVKNTTELSVFGVLYYNTILTLPLLGALMATSTELSSVLEFPYLLDPGFQFFFITSAVMALGLNIATFYATTLNSPLAVSVCGQMKSFLVFVASLLVFTDYVFEPVNMMGLCISLLGTVLYGHWSYQESHKARQEASSLVQPQLAKVVGISLSTHTAPNTATDSNCCCFSTTGF